jgi:PAS domain S-box-containing protein
LPPEGKATAVWPASGIALAGVLIVGYRVWPGIWVGAFLANLGDFFAPANQSSLTTHLVVSSAIASGSTLQALLGAYLIRLLMGDESPLDRARSVFQFIGVALLMCLVASTIGVTTLYIVGLTSWENYGFNWLTWWLGDLMGVLVVTPLGLAWSRPLNFAVEPRRLAEAGLLLGVLVGMSLWVSGRWTLWGEDTRLLKYMTVPLLAWAAFRFGPRGATSALLPIWGIAVWGTANNQGAWVRETLNDSIMLLQTYVGVLAVTALTISGVLAERRRSETALQESADRLRRAQQAGRVGVWDWNVTTGQVAWDGIDPIRGLEPGGSGASFEEYLEYIHPEDRDRIVKALDLSVEQGVELDEECCVVWPDGSVHWVHGKGQPFRDEQGRTVRLSGTCQDITLRREAEEASRRLKEEIVLRAESQLRESREMFFRLFEFAPDTILVVNENGLITRANAKTEEMFGYTRGELADQLLELLVPDHLAHGHAGNNGQHFQHPFPRPMGVSLELLARRKDGTEFPVEMMLSPVETDQARVVLSVIRDVTQRRRAEAELNFQGQIIRNMAEGINVVRASDGTIIYTNPRFEEMFGYGPGELIGKHISVVNAPGEKSPEEVAGEIITVLETEGVWRGEVLNIKKDGILFWSYVYVTGFEHHEYGKVWISNQADITGRKTAEAALRESDARFRSLVESANAAIITADEDGSIVSWNQGALNVFGYTEAEVLGRSITLLMPERYHEAHRRGLEEVKKTGKGNLSGKTAEFEALRKDGSEFPIEVSLFSWRTGSRRFFSGIIYDITERKAVEAQNRQALQREMLLKEEVHHRVKNNLQMINSLLYLQSAGIADQTTQEILRESQSRVKSIALVHEKLYQLEDTEKVDFAEYATDLVADLLRAYGVSRQNIQVRTDIRDTFLGIDTAVPCGLIINELVSNVFKHAFVDGVEPKVWIKHAHRVMKSTY